MSVINKALARINRQKQIEKRNEALKLSGASVTEAALPRQLDKMDIWPVWAFVFLLAMIWLGTYMLDPSRDITQKVLGAVEGLMVETHVPAVDNKLVHPVIQTVQNAKVKQLLEDISFSGMRPISIFQMPLIDLGPWPSFASAVVLSNDVDRAVERPLPANIRMSSIHQIAAVIEALIYKGDLDEAYELLDEVRLGFKDASIALIRAASAMQAQGLVQEAIDLLSADINVARVSVARLGKLAILYDQVGDFKGQEKIYLKLIQRDPSNVLWPIGLAGVYEQQRRWLEAVRFYADALRFESIKHDQYKAVRQRLISLKRYIESLGKADSP